MPEIPLDTGRTGIPEEHEMPAPVTTTTRRDFAMARLIAFRVFRVAALGVLSETFGSVAQFNSRWTGIAVAVGRTMTGHNNGQQSGFARFVPCGVPATVHLPPPLNLYPKFIVLLLLPLSNNNTANNRVTGKGCGNT